MFNFELLFLQELVGGLLVFQLALAAYELLLENINDHWVVSRVTSATRHHWVACSRKSVACDVLVGKWEVVEPCVHLSLEMALGETSWGSKVAIVTSIFPHEIVWASKELITPASGIFSWGLLDWSSAFILELRLDIKLHIRCLFTIHDHVERCPWTAWLGVCLRWLCQSLHRASLELTLVLSDILFGMSMALWVLPSYSHRLLLLLVSLSSSRRLRVWCKTVVPIDLHCLFSSNCTWVMFYFTFMAVRVILCNMGVAHVFWVCIGFWLLLNVCFNLHVWCLLFVNCIILRNGLSVVQWLLVRRQLHWTCNLGSWIFTLARHHDLRSIAWIPNRAVVVVNKEACSIHCSWCTRSIVLVSSLTPFDFFNFSFLVQGVLRATFVMRVLLFDLS